MTRQDSGGALFLNFDCTDFFGNHDTRGDGGAMVDRYIDLILDAGVTTFLCNTQAERVNYDSDVWEPFWTGYDPGGPDDQPFLRGATDSWDASSPGRWRRLVDSMLNLHLQGVDYPARVVRRCRERGVCPWVSLRMNDVHHQDKDEHPIHSDFWRAHPELRRRGYEGHFAKALDYAHEAVRNHYLALATETLERYDMDGLELDFMREPYLFSKGEEEAGREILTDWLRTVRALVDRHAAARGHAIRLGVRVPSRPETAALFGLDAVWWSQEGIVDLLVVTPRWASTEFDMPVRDWRRLLEGSSTTLAGGLEVLVRPFRDGPAHGATPAEALGAAAQVLHDGADSVYLFNYFPSGQPAGGARHWSAEEYAATLRAMTSLDSIVQHPRRHVITFSDVGTPAGDEGRASQLPAEGTDLAFQLPTGPAPGAGWKAELRVDVGREGAAAAAPPTASVNGSAATQKERCGEADGPCTHVYEVPVDALRASGGNRIDVHGVDGLPIKGVGVSIGLCAGD